MQTFQHLVKDPDGLHARPAGLLVKCAKGCSSDIQIVVDDKTVDAKHLFAVMGLCVKQSDNITFRIEGEDEQHDCSRLEAFCRENI